jgi:hypothetical protein
LIREGRPLILVRRRPPLSPYPSDTSGEVYSYPWPDALPGLGLRRVDAFDQCSGCETWSWVRYGGLALCLNCARKARRNNANDGNDAALPRSTGEKEATLVTLDPVTIRAVLGDQPDPNDLAIVTFDVVAAVHRIELSIRSGVLPLYQVIHGRPLADWLDMAEVARLLRLGAEDRP